MKNEQYFPMEINMINKSKESKLIEVHGPKGFGTYIMLLTELRHNPDYRCTLNALKGMARRCKISQTLLKQVLYDFELFEITHDGKEVVISSPYMDKVMGAYDKRLRKLAEASAKGYDKVSRQANGKFTASGGALDKIRLDKIKLEENTTTAVAVVDTDAVDFNLDNKIDSWEQHLDNVAKDEVWMQLLAMKSGISRLFTKYRKEAVEAFRQHIRLQGKGTDIVSTNEMKAYFANFLRQGSPTQKRIAAQLALLEEQSKESEPYRFETVDPITGERSYFGNPIPPEAPPRPYANAAWSDSLNKWL